MRNTAARRPITASGGFPSHVDCYCRDLVRTGATDPWKSGAGNGLDGATRYRERLLDFVSLRLRARVRRSSRTQYLLRAAAHTVSHAVGCGFVLICAGLYASLYSEKG